MKNLPKKCPKCEGTDLRLHSYSPFYVNDISVADVICLNCGNIGYLKFTCHIIRGTFVYAPEEENI